MNDIYHLVISTIKVKTFQVLTFILVFLLSAIAAFNLLEKTIWQFSIWKSLIKFNVLADLKSCKSLIGDQLRPLNFYNEKLIFFVVIWKETPKQLFQTANAPEFLWSIRSIQLINLLLKMKRRIQTWFPL